MQVGAVNGDNIVATVGRRVENGLMFAHKSECDGRSDAAEGAGVGADVDEVPGAGVSQTRLNSCVSCDLLALHPNLLSIRA